MATNKPTYTELPAPFTYVDDDGFYWWAGYAHSPEETVEEACRRWANDFVHWQYLGEDTQLSREPETGDAFAERVADLTGTDRDFVFEALCRAIGASMLFYAPDNVGTVRELMEFNH